jgi:beta-lactam-binding protein with PASTA domain
VLGSLKGQPKDTVLAALKAAGFSTDGIVPTQQADPKIPANSVIDVINVSTNASVLGQKIDSSTQLGLIISSGPQLFTVPSGLKGQDYNSAVNTLKGLGFTNVTPVQDPTGGNGQAANTVTHLANVTEGQQYPANQPITVYYAPQPVTTPPPTSTACDPLTDPNQCQGQPSNPPPSNNTTAPGGPGNPSTSPTTKHG